MCKHSFHASSALPLIGDNGLHCALKTEKHLFKNRSSYHHNPDDGFGLTNARMACHLDGVLLFPIFAHQ